MERSCDMTVEFKDLILNASSLVRLETNVYHIALHPSNLADLKSAIKENLDSSLYKFNSKFGGFLIGYKNVKIASDTGSLINDDYFIHFNIIADFYIFSPKVGCVLYGIVNKKSPDHLGCLVHKYFNVSIPRPTKESREEWLGASVEIGHKVTFVLQICDFSGNLPYMRGSILSSCPVNSDDEVQLESKKKKKKKLHNNKEQEDSLAISESQLEEISDRLAKRKREIDDEDGTSKKKKKKRKHEDDNEDQHLESNSLHMSSEDPDFSEVIEHIRKSYLQEDVQDIKDKNVKEKTKNKKRKVSFEDEFVDIPDGIADIPQSIHSKDTEEITVSEHTENKKKKHKKNNEKDENLEKVLPDLVSLLKTYNSKAVGVANVGQETPDNIFTGESLTGKEAIIKNKDKQEVKKNKEKHKLKKNKHKHKNSKKEKKGEKGKRKHGDKDKKSKARTNLGEKKSKKKKETKNSGLDDLTKLSSELLQKYLKEKGAS